MSILQDRKAVSDAIAKGRFINHVLKEEAKEINADITKRLSGFTAAFWSKRNLSVSDTTLTYTTLLQHRFADMKTRQTKTGVITKKRYKIHNAPIYGHLNNIARELAVGFTKDVKHRFKTLEK